MWWEKGYNERILFVRSVFMKKLLEMISEEMQAAFEAA